MKSTMYALITMLGMLLVGVGAPSAQVIMKTETITFLDTEIEAVKTADNFIVLFNGARTMGRPFKQTGMSHLQAAKQILQERNDLMPELSYNAGLYTFAPNLKGFKANYAMRPYNKTAFGDAIAKLPTEAKGRTEIQRTLVHLEPVLKGLSGKTVIFLFTDGTNTEVQPAMALTANEFARTPRELAWDLAQKYNICFKVISSAQGEAEKEMVRNVSRINECSRVLPLEDLKDRPEYMAGSLFRMNEKVFEVIKKRQRVVGFNVPSVRFDFNSAIVRPEYQDKLTGLGKFLQANPAAYTVLAGFTDDVGSQEFNLGLARRRVEGVRKYLQTQFNITQDRIVTLYYGALAPAKPNDTEEGRAKNRRVSGIVAGL